MCYKLLVEMVSFFVLIAFFHLFKLCVKLGDYELSASFCFRIRTLWTGAEELYQLNEECAADLYVFMVDFHFFSPLCIVM